MHRRQFFAAPPVFPLLVLTTLFVAHRSAAADPIEIATVEHEGPVDFQKQILPVLRKKCLACHNATDAESDLILEDPAAIIKGGSEGPAAVPGNGGESVVLQVAAHRAEPVMPPEDNDVGAEPLTPQELGLLKLWIDQGAKGDVLNKDVIQWRPLPPGVNPVFAVASAPHGRLVAAGRANQIFLYRPLGKRGMGRLTDPNLLVEGDTRPGAAHRDMIQSLAFHPDGQSIASGGYRTLKIWRRAADLVRKVPTEAGAALSSDVSRDGSRLVAAHEGGQITVWNLASGEEIARWSAESGPVVALAISDDHSTVATAAADKTLRLWDLGEQRQLQSVTLDGDVNHLCWVGSDRLIAAVGDVAKVWKLSESRELSDEMQLAGHGKRVTAVAAAGSTLITTGEDGTVRSWNLQSGKQEKQLDHGGPVSRLTASPDGKRCVSGGPTGAKLWDLEQGKIIAELKGDQRLQEIRQRSQLEFEVAQQHVTNAKKDLADSEKRKKQEEDNLKKVDESHKKADEDLKKKLEAEQNATKAQQSAQTGNDDAKQQLASSEKQLADAGDDEEAKKQATHAVEAAKKAVEPAEKKLEEAQKALKKATDEKTAAQRTLESADRSLERAKEAVARAEADLAPLKDSLAKVEEQVKVEESRFKEAEKNDNEFQLIPADFAFNADGSQIAVASATGSVSIWTWPDGELDRQIHCGDQPLHAVVFAPDGLLWTVGPDAELRQWRTTDDYQLAQVIGSTDDKSTFMDRVTAISFSPDGKYIAVGGGEPSRGGELKIVSLEDTSQVREIEDAHSDTVFGIAFSPDGKYLATCGADRFIKVFEVETGKHLKTFEGHTHHVLDVDWQADGRVLASAGADKVVKVWDFRNGSQIRTISGFGKEVTSLQFAGSSNRFYVACGDQSLYRCDTAGKRDGIGSAGDFLYAVSSNLTGNSVVFAGHDSVVRVVNADGKELVELNPPQQ